MSGPGPAQGGPKAGTSYVFRGSGRIPQQAATAADDFRGILVVPVPPDTIVFGTVADSASIPRILRRLESLGMHVNSVHRVRELPRQAVFVNGKTRPIRE